MDFQFKDLFRDALTEAKKTTVWDRLTLEQQSMLVSRHINQHFVTMNRQDPENPAPAEELFASV